MKKEAKSIETMKHQVMVCIAEAMYMGRKVDNSLMHEFAAKYQYPYLSVKMTKNRILKNQNDMTVILSIVEDADTWNSSFYGVIVALAVIIGILVYIF